MSIETLIRDANPISAEEIESPDSERAARILDEVLLVPRGTLTRKRRNLFVGALAAVVLLVVIGQAVTNTFFRSSTAAAVELHRIAHVADASSSPLLTLGPGRYLYSEIETLQGETFSVGSAANQFDITFRKTVQEWQAASGAGREVITYDSAPAFTTPASRKGWILSGRPSIAPPSNRKNGGYASSWSASSKFAVHPANESMLPTNVGQLQTLLQHGGPDLPGNLVANVDTPSTPAGTFGAAAEILETPSIGSSPALRSALYQVLANVPGVRLLGEATDWAGRRGLQVAAPADNGERTQLIIDPHTGDILQTENVVVDPSQLTRGVRKYFGSKRGEVFSWTDFLGSGVVTSASAVSK